MTIRPSLPENIEISSLSNSLTYLHVSELKAYCEKLALSSKGTKMTLISRMIHFLKTGEKIELPPYPASSLSRGQKVNALKPDALMLKDAYKNDLKTRLFFKNLIGDFFHFTAFGIDWLEERWRQGNPPTYQEFANMWQKEYAFRKANGSPPKEEWAYINFVKRYLKETPQASRKDILKQWEIERNDHKDRINKLLKDHLWLLHPGSPSP